MITICGVILVPYKSAKNTAIIWVSFIGQIILDAIAPKQGMRIPNIGYAYNDVADDWPAKVKPATALSFTFGNSGKRTITLQIGTEAQGLMPFAAFGWWLAQSA
ncbi:hypothetical protein D3C80_1518520 [compost metagenome]